MTLTMTIDRVRAGATAHGRAEALLFSQGGRSARQADRATEERPPPVPELLE